ncbi:MAG: type III-B CRISPR module RAMP protein Cmr4 [Candidatus Competibacteraceae bacterium]|nr:type III-B CRISPR module RAMP protein Cmr4 [Candidatus Competibacteraceae bacterium]MCB1821436.1 type III-B CRISPR module RAMP protein Cmr4 [Candidatus Competibacteraceae bacterium]
MNNNTALLGLLAETSIHAGAGQMAGVIDLPIQREAHTDWPVVFGSAVKGALRTLADEQKAPWLNAVFGPETANASDHAGALLVSDARLLLLPVRSLTSHFKWVTCPALLKRFQTDMERLGLGNTAFAVPEVTDLNQALTSESAANALFLEEFRFTVKSADLGGVITALARLMGREDAAAALQRQLVVVNDDRFSHLARFATPVNPHVCINNQTKTVKPGALWYEESLPSDTVLYVSLYAQAARVNGETKTATDVLKHITQDLFARPYLQLGGNETVGMGWCKVTICREEG